jgi:hypothetical protein
MSNAGVFRESLTRARARAEQGQRLLLVDLGAVEYLDTAGPTQPVRLRPGNRGDRLTADRPGADDFRAG